MIMLHIEDSIVRQVTLPATPDVVWQKSFASAEALASWFPQAIEGDFVEGGSVDFIWGELRCECRIVRLDPGKCLVYQWHPGDAFRLSSHPEGELTTVEFLLEECEGGTKVTVTESGFLRIAKQRQGMAFEQNFGGWDEEFPKLAKSYGL